jgi:hypothetical protein
MVNGSTITGKLNIKSKKQATDIFVQRVELFPSEMLEECIGRFLTIKPYQNAVSIFNVIIPDGSHIQYVLNEGAAELAKICICHVVGHPKNANERVPSNREIRGGGRRR